MKTLKDILGDALVGRVIVDNAVSKTGSNFVDNGIMHPDVYLFQKWAYRVPKNWYGFSLGHEVPLSWARSIDKVLRAIELAGIDFEIHQIKLKFGGLRFYILMKSDTLTEEIHQFNLVIKQLESLLNTPNLIY